MRERRLRAGDCLCFADGGTSDRFSRSAMNGDGSDHLAHFVAICGLSKVFKEHNCLLGDADHGLQHFDRQHAIITHYNDASQCPDPRMARPAFVPSSDVAPKATHHLAATAVDSQFHVQSLVQV